MNKKGFTLIELLATLLILGLVTGIVVTVSLSSYKKARQKSEEVFKANIIKATEAYIAAHSSEYRKGGEFKFTKIIDDGYLIAKDITNPNNEEVICYDNETIVKVTCNEDMVYCFEMTLNCLTEKINTCGG